MQKRLCIRLTAIVVCLLCSSAQPCFGMFSKKTKTRYRNDIKTTLADQYKHNTHEIDALIKQLYEKINKHTLYLLNNVVKICSEAAIGASVAAFAVSACYAMYNCYENRNRRANRFR